MHTTNYIEDRKPIWVTISKLYLDTELDKYDFEQMAQLISASLFSLEEVKRINKKDVFPLLFWNLLSVAGVWDGFDEAWLVETIIKKKKRSNLLKRFCYSFMYFCMRGRFKNQWQKIESYYS